MTKLACVPVYNPFTADSRVLRTCRFLRRQGFEVHVLAAGRADLAAEEVVDGIQVHRFGSSAMKKATTTIRRGVDFLRAFGTYSAGAAAWVRRHRPQLIHYNDWNTLPLGPAAGVATRSIYDMHELFQDLDYLKFPRPMNRAIAAIDRAGLRRAEAVICVSEPIREELQRLTKKPVYVVRNIPERPPLEGSGDPAIVAHLADGRKHLVFLGGLQRAKGATYMLDVLRHLPEEFVLDCFSGRTSKNAFFLEHAEQLGVASRVTVFDLVPQSVLAPTIRHAFAGLSVFVPSSRIYDYALPNKLFEYLLAGIPVIVSAARAQVELVRPLGVGLVADLADPEETARRIASWERPAVTPELLERSGLTWEQEEGVLARVYRDVGII